MIVREEVLVPRVLLQVYSTLNLLNAHPQVAWLVDTPVGRYLKAHQFAGLTVLVFVAMATGPLSAFVVFAVVTFTGVCVAFLLLEGSLLLLGGAMLLCVLCLLAVAACALSSLLAMLYITCSNLHHLYSAQQYSSVPRDQAQLYLQHGVCEGRKSFRQE